MSRAINPQAYANEVSILNADLLTLVRMHFAAVLKKNNKSPTACGITEGQWQHLHKDDNHSYSILEARLDVQLLEVLGLDERDCAEIHVTFRLGMCDVIDTNHPHDCLLLNRQFAKLDEIITGASLSAAAQAKLIASNTALSLQERVNNFSGVVVGFALLV